MFDRAGLRGRVLNAALHHQHARVYNHSSTTRYGAVEAGTAAAALQFLAMAHFAEGARLFTYVLTLDGLLRFTETGKEFGIDLLSKHTMHSDVNVYVACSGEFFIRRVGPGPGPASSSSADADPSADPDPDPADYELVIDNDSGTYRPNAALLPQLAAFLSRNLPGLRVAARDCADEKLQRMKREQREARRRLGAGAAGHDGDDDDARVFGIAAPSDGGWSSSDEESLDERARGKRSRRDRMFDVIEDPEMAIRRLRGKGRGGDAVEGEGEGEAAEGSASK